MFRESKGSWFCMIAGIVPSLFIAIMLHNLMVSSEHAITSATDMEMRSFGKLTQCCSVSADLLAILMVTDAVLQEEKGVHRYQEWAPRVRHFYTKGWRGFFRVVLVWVVALASIVGFATGILHTGKASDDVKWENEVIGGLSEVARAVLVCGIFFSDLFTVVQDWEFPSFTPGVDIMIAGTFSVELKCRCLRRCTDKLPSWPSCCVCRKHLPDANFAHLTVTGPWLTYGPLLVVICLDLFCMKNQIFYVPSTYGQYAHPMTERVWTIVDKDYLLQAYTRGVLTNAEMITYGARWNVTTGQALSASALTDIQLTSRYTASSLKYIAIIPSFLLIAGFWVLVFFGNANHLKLVEFNSNMLKKSAQAKEFATQEIKQVSGMLSSAVHTCEANVARVMSRAEDTSDGPPGSVPSSHVSP